MSSEVIQSMAALGSQASATSLLSPAGTGAAANFQEVDSSLQPSFGQLVGEGLQQVNRQLMVSQTDLQQLAMGDAQNLHQIMIGLEESRLSFQLLMQVRNRLLESYQDVMKMQV